MPDNGIEARSRNGSRLRFLPAKKKKKKQAKVSNARLNS
jgi:hypothetical protein